MPADSGERPPIEPIGAPRTAPGPAAQIVAGARAAHASWIGWSTDSAMRSRKDLAMGLGGSPMPLGHAQSTIVGMSSPLLRKLLAGGGARIALAVAAPAASADSIAYVKDGDIYLSTSDGSRQYRVT